MQACPDLGERGPLGLVSLAHVAETIRAPAALAVAVSLTAGRAVAGAARTVEALFTGLCGGAAVAPATAARRTAARHTRRTDHVVLAAFGWWAARERGGRLRGGGHDVELLGGSGISQRTQGDSRGVLHGDVELHGTHRLGSATRNGSLERPLHEFHGDVGELPFAGGLERQDRFGGAGDGRAAYRNGASGLDLVAHRWCAGDAITGCGNGDLLGLLHRRGRRRRAAHDRFELGLDLVGGQRGVQGDLGIGSFGRLEGLAGARHVLVPATTHQAHVHPGFGQDGGAAAIPAGFDDAQEDPLRFGEIGGQVVGVDCLVNLRRGGSILGSRCQLRRSEKQGEGQNESKSQVRFHSGSLGRHGARVRGGLLGSWDPQVQGEHPALVPSVRMNWTRRFKARFLSESLGTRGRSKPYPADLRRS